MSTIEELKSELKTIKEQISERKLIANRLKLPGKVYRVAEFYGKMGTGYCFSEKGLVITCEAEHIKSPSIRVTLGTINSIVFLANLHKNDVGQIHLYSPGDWEKKIEKLYNEIPEMQRKREISYLQDEINDLKKKWHIKEPIKCRFWQYCKSYREVSDVCTGDQSSCMSFKEFKAGERLLEVINVEEKSI